MSCGLKCLVCCPMGVMEATDNSTGSPNCFKNNSEGVQLYAEAIK